MATYKVKLTGSGVDTTINCPDDQYILDAAEDFNGPFKPNSLYFSSMFSSESKLSSHKVF